MNRFLQIRPLLVALLLFSASFATKAQTKKALPIASDGFWVVETPPNSRACTVRFYTNDRMLIYEETIHRCLKITRRQTKRQLNIALEQALFVWNATHQVPTDRQWVAVRFDKK